MTTPVAPVSTHHRVVTVSLALACQGFQAISLSGLALMLPLIRADLGLSFTQAGALSLTATVVYAAMQIPAGFVADRFGPRRLFFIGVLGTVLMGLAFGLQSSYGQALAIQATSGFFRALMFVPGLSLVTAWFPPERRATAMGLYTVGSFTSNVVLELTSPLLANAYDWRAPFLLYSSIGILVSLAFLKFGRDAPRRGPARQSSMSDILAPFRYRIMWLCAGVQYIRLSVVMGIQFWLPSLLVEEKGVALATAGVIAALRSAFVAPSNTLGGYVSDRLKNPALVIALSLLVLAATTALLPVVDNLALLVGLVLLNAVFVQFYFGPLFSIPVEVLGPSVAGTTSGFSNTFANLGALTFAYALGAIKDSTGSFQIGFLSIALMCVVGVALAAALGRARSGVLAQQRTEGAAV